MRKTFLILSLLALGVLTCTEEGFAQLGRRRGGCAGAGPYYYGQGAYNYNGAPGSYAAGGQGPIGVRQSFYLDPNLQQASRVTILLPNTDAQVWFDGAATTQRGMERVFVTPALTQEGTYTIKASWKDNGKTIDRERRVQVRPGQATMIDFRANPSESLPLPLPKTPPPPTPKQEGAQTSLLVSDPPEQRKDNEKMPLLKIDGEWTPIYVEKEGAKVDKKDFTNVTIKNNVVTCRHGGKVQSFHLDFGPHHMIRCRMQEGDSALTRPTEQRGAHTHHGVYVASQNYLAISLNKGMDHRAAAAPAARAGANANEGTAQRGAKRWESQGPYGADMVIILQRAGTTQADSR